MSNTQKLSAWSLAFILFLIGVYVLRDVLLPFVAGIAIAYFLDPLTSKLQKKMHSRIAAVCVVSAILILLVLLCIFIVVPIVQKQLSIFIANLPVYAGLLWSKIEPYAMELKRLFPQQADDLRHTVAEHF